MLARLEEIDGVEHAEVDFAADFMRLSVRDDAVLVLAVTTLRALGYEGTKTREPGDVARWYDRGSVGELSRVEAQVISGRVIARYKERHAVTGEVEQALRALIVTALHTGFVGIGLVAGPSPERFRIECVAHAVSAIAPLVGAQDADEIGTMLDDDMKRPHHKETRIHL